MRLSTLARGLELARDARRAWESPDGRRARRVVRTVSRGVRVAREAGEYAELAAEGLETAALYSAAAEGDER